MYSGEFQDLDVFSDCLCPNTHPSAITNHTGLDLYCAQNNNDLNILRRDNPLEGFSEAVGLYLPEFLTDGMALPIADLSTVSIPRSQFSVRVRVRVRVRMCMCMCMCMCVRVSGAAIC